MSEQVHHVSFDKVLAKELDDIRNRRRGPSDGADAASTQPASDPDATSTDDLKRERAQQRAALNLDLAGLALSGGGIRSATFALGVLQGLASFNLLRRFDYLSTVSGGGYIGSWLAAWIKRAGDIVPVEQQLKASHREQARDRDYQPGQPMDEEPEPIYHLRAYSSYLTPHRGLFTADSFVVLAIYLRNIFLNQLVLFPACVAALLIPRLFERFYSWDGNGEWDPILLGAMFVVLGVALIGLAVHFLVLNQPSLQKWATEKIHLQHRVQFFHVAIVLQLLLFAVLSSWFLSWDLVPWTPQKAKATIGHGASPSGPVVVSLALVRGESGWWTSGEPWLPWSQAKLRAWEEQQNSSTTHWLSGALLFGTIFGGIVLVLMTPFRVARFILSMFNAGRPGGRKWWIDRLLELLRDAWALVCSFLAGFTGGALIYLVFAEVLRGVYDQSSDVALVTTIGAPLVLAAIVVGVSVFVGLLGTLAGEDEREWWASLCGWLLIYMLTWAVLVGIALFGPWLLVQAGGWIQGLLGTGWVVTAASGVWAGRSDRTGSARSNRPLEWLTLIAPPVFLVGLLVVISLLLDWLQDNVPGQGAAQTMRYFDHRLDSSTLGLFLLTLGCIAFTLFMAIRIDVNVFSLHGLYANRLVRCYLGASRYKKSDKLDRHLGVRALPEREQERELRKPDPITGFDPTDDFLLNKLGIGVAHGQDNAYWGPYPLINAALNLVHGDELAWQERKAESFVFTPHYCGSGSTRYSRLKSSDLRLGTAVTLSGAAVSPNMGYHSSPAVTALLTVFNVRLGGWVANPRYRPPGNAGPRFGLLYFFKELFGRTNDRASFVYLSDGGHFDNMGLYELVRRRCRYIIVCDGEEDGDYVFDGLSSVIRKCQIDFGVTIEIDVTPIRPQASDGRSRWHCAIGRIHYEDAQLKAVPGILLYLKASLTGDEPSDVRNYAQEHSSFPHETTANQFFTESQFESHRALGYHIAREVFKDAMKDVEPSTDRSEGIHRRVVNKLFSNLHSRWFPPPPGFNESFLQSVEGYVRIEKELRTDPNLRDFSRVLYPELGLEAVRAENGANGATLEQIAERRRAELHLVSQMLQVMEDAWLSLDLEGYFAHPMNRGWMNTFRRWTAARSFRRCWPALRGEFSKDFVRFCEQELGLRGGRLHAMPIPFDEALLAAETAPNLDPPLEWQRRALQSFREEFTWEWPRQEKLEQLIKKAWQWGGNDAPSTWLLVLEAEEGQQATPLSEGSQACGIVLFWQPGSCAKKLELLVWIHRPYRDLGLGRKGIENILRQIKDKPKYEGVSVQARFPLESFLGPNDRQRSAMWRTFLTFYRFRPEDPEHLNGQKYEVMKASEDAWQLLLTEC